MKAIISKKYGSPETLELKEIARPGLKENEVLVKVHAASINYGNIVLLRGKPYVARLAFGITKPKFLIPGGDMAGIVEAIGEKVTEFRIGDEVYGDLSGSGWGTFAEYVAVSDQAIAHKPSNLSFEEAAAVPMAATTALQAIRDKGRIGTGQKVLIQGASGGVGTFAMQIAKAYGAEVTAVVSTRNVEIAKDIGVDHIIDYKKDNLANLNQLYDVIVGVNGSQTISTYKHILKPNGIFVHVGGSSSQMYKTMFIGSWVSLFGKKKFVNFMQKPSKKDLVFLKEIIEAGKVKPVIDSSYPLCEVSKALKYFEEGHSRGKVVITIH
ncbi:NAD(P)-dependent alcohol dehydrogenase [Ornithinibacillus sp. 179-J 7C1 HS]|uniref:NAD(P)-dependent alcohol dehydrogenase n=1 Tax=Ornithinibacillus sp. 179-J 7C1 HS TaxID=3142384 RepID=UPI0039A215A2